jgi:N utilization substance protein B
MVGNRRQARESALSYLYQWDSKVDTSTDQVHRFAGYFDVQPSFRDYFEKLTLGVTENVKVLDSEIEAAAENWSLYRMSKIDRNILRMGCYELKFCPETSAPIILDEAIELAKIYGSQDSASFVNGILDRLAKKTRAAEPQADVS